MLFGFAFADRRPRIFSINLGQSKDFFSCRLPAKILGSRTSDLGNFRGSSLSIIDERAAQTHELRLPKSCKLRLGRA